MAYYVFDDAKNLFEGMTKEQIVNAIASATGVDPSEIDADVITTAIKEQNAQKSVNLWVGTQNEYNAIQQPDENTLYCVTDPHETNEMQSQIDSLQSQVDNLVVANTTNASGLTKSAQVKTVDLNSEGRGVGYFTVPNTSQIVEASYASTGAGNPIYHTDGISYKIQESGTSPDSWEVRVDIDINEASGQTDIFSEQALVRLTYVYEENITLPELTDIRVGADGTVYETAGEAVRTQVTAATPLIVRITRSGTDHTSSATESEIMSAISAGRMVVANTPTGRAYYSNDDDGATFYSFWGSSNSLKVSRYVVDGGTVSVTNFTVA